MRKTIVLLTLVLFIALPMGSALSEPQKKDLKDLKFPPPGQLKQSDAQKVDALFAQWNKTDSPGLALAVIRDGRTIYQRCYGMANLEYGLSIATATVFVIASLSKQFTAFCILLLAQGGLLNLDDDVRKHIPELPDFGKKITIRHLIHHTSGIREHGDLARFAGWREGDILTERDVLDLMSKQKELNFEPGSQHLYCNTGYLLLSVVIKRTSGKSLREFAKENVFAPLGMRSTEFRDNHLMVIPNVAASYEGGLGGWQHCFNHNGYSGPGNLHTTVEDLALWDQNFYDAKVGGQRVIDQMHEQFTLADGKVTSYACGLRLDTYRGIKAVHHSGSIAGYRTTLLRFPEQKFSVILLANAANFGPLTGYEPLGNALAAKVADIYLSNEFKEEKPKSLLNKPTLPGKKNAPGLLSVEAQKDFIGTFFSEELEVVYQVIYREPPGAGLRVIHRKGDFALLYRSADEFIGTDKYLGPVTLRFTRNSQKQANGFMIDTERVKHLKFVRAEIKLQK